MNENNKYIIENGVVIEYNGNDKKITLPNNAEIVGSLIVGNVNEIVEVIIPEGYTTISADAFANFDSLQKVRLPSTLVELGERTFLGCKNLTEIEIPPSVRYIPIGCFALCENLQKVTLNGDCFICDKSFSFCISLKEIINSHYIIVVGKYAFEGCKSLEKNIN